VTAGQATPGAPRDALVMAKPVGPRCNLRCDYCYYLAKEQLFPADAPRRMPDDLLESYIAQRLQASPSEPVHFEWHGGEPTLLGLDYFRRIVALERKHAPPGCEFTNGLQTNGLLLDDAWGAFLAESRFSVGLSLDGPADVHDGFRKTVSGQPTHCDVVRAFHVLAKHGVRSDVLCVLHAQNVRAPARVYGFFRELGVRSLQFLPLVEPDPSRSSGVSVRTVRPEAIGEFLCTTFDAWMSRDLGLIVVQFFDEALRPELGLPHALCIWRETCGDVVVLEHDGSVYACDHFVCPSHRIGSLRERPLADLLSDPALRAFGQDKQDRLPAACRACDVLAWCNGGCPKDRLVHSDANEAGLSYLCPAYKRFFRHARPVMERLAVHWQAGLPLRSFIASPRPVAVATAGPKVGPNDPCPCGSGRKYKKCCRG
jgi:uncharacterized protein